MLCLFSLYIFVSFKYDFLVDAVRVIVKIKKYLPRWFRKIYCMARYLFRREGLPICGGHAQLNLYLQVTFK